MYLLCFDMSHPFLARGNTIKQGSDHIIWIFGNSQTSPLAIFLVICCIFSFTYPQSLSNETNDIND